MENRFNLYYWELVIKKIEESWIEKCTEDIKNRKYLCWTIEELTNESDSLWSTEHDHMLVTGFKDFKCDKKNIINEKEPIITSLEDGYYVFRTDSGDSASVDLITDDEFDSDKLKLYYRDTLKNNIASCKAIAKVEYDGVVIYEYYKNNDYYIVKTDGVSPYIPKDQIEDFEWLDCNRPEMQGLFQVKNSKITLILDESAW